MIVKPNSFKRFFLIVLVFTSGLGLKAQGLQPTDSLYKQVAYLDSVLFTSFNNRDVKTFAYFFAEDLEFFHDKGGLTGYNHTVNFAKAQADAKSDLRRTLVPGTLEIYPIPNYGAMQIGSHRFCHTENGQQDCGTFKFIHIWKQTGTEWKITRILSYDH